MPRILQFRRKRAGASTFEHLVRPHLEFLHRLAWRFSGSAADAEDLVQEVLLKLYPRREELAAIEQLRPWLARVLYRQFIDELRRRARSAVSAPDNEPPDAPAPAEDGPDAHAERAEWRSRIVAALGQLSPEQRAIVAMHDVEGFTLEELEPILEAPLGTLKSRLHRARRRLRALLGMEPFAAG